MNIEWITLPALSLSILLCPAILNASDPKPPSSPPDTNQTTYERPVDYSSRGSRVRLGAISVGAGFNYWNGPAFGRGYVGPGYGYSGPAAWNPMWWDPWFGPGFWPASSWVHPGYWGGFAQSPSAGEIELRTPNKEDTVTIDGAYAGVAKDLKSFWLEPGVYIVGVSDADGNSFERKIYVLSGKTLRLHAVLSEPAPVSTRDAKESKP